MLFGITVTPIHINFEQKSWRSFEFYANVCNVCNTVYLCKTFYRSKGKKSMTSFVILVFLRIRVTNDSVTGWVCNCWKLNGEKMRTWFRLFWKYILGERFIKKISWQEIITVVKPNIIYSTGVLAQLCLSFLIRRVSICRKYECDDLRLTAYLWNVQVLECNFSTWKGSNERGGCWWRRMLMRCHDEASWVSEIFCNVDFGILRLLHYLRSYYWRVVKMWPIISGFLDPLVKKKGKNIERLYWKDVAMRPINS